MEVRTMKNSERIMQCILCKHDPETCGCTEKDENEDLSCKKYERKDSANN